MADMRTHCNKPLHKHCRCVREPHHDGKCNCTYRNPDPKIVRESNKSWGEENDE